MHVIVVRAAYGNVWKIVGNLPGADKNRKFQTDEKYNGKKKCTK